MEYKKFTTNFANREISVEIGRIGCLANGACLVKYGKTTVMVHATMSKQQRQEIDFFPLSVEYEEKQYAAGKIPGSFLKREGKPSESAILNSRCIDRSIRPFFPKDMRHEVTIIATVLSTDYDNSPLVCSMLAVAVAISISDIPWNGPILGAEVGLINDKIIINPNKEERKKSQLDLTVAANKDKIAMIEAGAKELEEEKMLNCIEAAHEEIKKMIDFVNKIKNYYNTQKITYEGEIVPEEILNLIKKDYIDGIKAALENKDKMKRDEEIQIIIDEIKEKYENLIEEMPENIIETAIYKVEKEIVRNWLLKEKKRVDGRKMDEIRPLSCDVDFIPIVHGCGMFARGQTQTMSIVTLGSVSEEQKLDGLDGQKTKRYIHHYNFPSYSVGETKTNRAPGRREIGHGALAERALKAVIPSFEEFPYTIRVVSETLSSNGSTSQSSICSSTIALMDAGVPIKSAVAGISCGLITDEDENFTTMLDIQGLEDFFGDMDFKVAGTKKGITAIQVDIKIDGLTMEIIKEVFKKTKDARIHIIDDVILKKIASPRKEVKETAPKIEQISIPPDKIKDVIGANGKVIQKLSSSYDVKIEVQDQGKTYILGTNLEKVKEAKKTIETIITNPKIGDIFTGVVTRIMPFGAFVKITPLKEGLLHISKIDFNKINKVQDVLNIGDNVIVKVIEIDEQGRINLSRKDVL